MKSRRAILLLACLSVAALAAAERAVHDRRAQALPSDGAQWIWAEGPWEKSAMPEAFLAACDFPLGDGSAAGAEMAILADEEYLLFVNGRLIGSNRYRRDAALDRYEIGDLLQPGTNRLLVELRSGRGAGGLLAVATLSGGEIECPSGPSWRIFRRRSPGVSRGWSPLDGGEKPRLWGFPPTGRWGTPVAGPTRIRLDSSHGQAVDPGRGREILAGSGEEKRARLLLYDWGDEVYGFLRLRFAHGEPSALLYAGESPPDPRLGPADMLVVGLSGDSTWRSASPLRLRYLVVGTDRELRSVDVLPYEPAMAEAYPPAAPQTGVFGLSAPPLRTPVEDEIRRELQGFAGLARREEP